MANNVAITSGVGTNIATDDISSVHYQVVKLAAGDEDSAVRIEGSTANGLEVDVTRVIPGTTATSLGKAEDAAHTSGDTGVMGLAVRKDTAAALAGTDGDYAPLEVDASGRLHVNVGAVVPGTAATNLGKAEDAAHTSGDTGVMALAVRSDVAAAIAGTTGDYAPLIVDATGRQWVNTELPDAAALADALANPTVPLVGAPALLFNGTTWDRERSNEEIVILASDARTATATSATLTNRNARGILVGLVVTAASGTGGLQLVVQERPSATANYGSINATPTAVTATGTTYYLIYPGANETNKATSIVQVASQPLGRTFRILVVHGDGSSYTYEVVACLIV